MLDSQRRMLARYLVEGKETVVSLLEYVLLGMEAPMAVWTETEHILHQVASPLCKALYVVHISIQMVPLLFYGESPHPLGAIDPRVADLAEKIIPAFEHFLEGGAAHIVFSSPISELLA